MLLLLSLLIIIMVVIAPTTSIVAIVITMFLLLIISILISVQSYVQEEPSGDVVEGDLAVRELQSPFLIVASEEREHNVHGPKQPRLTPKILKFSLLPILHIETKKFKFKEPTRRTPSSSDKVASAALSISSLELI